MASVYTAPPVRWMMEYVGHKLMSSLLSTDVCDRVLQP